MYQRIKFILLLINGIRYIFKYLIYLFLNLTYKYTE